MRNLPALDLSYFHYYYDPTSRSYHAFSGYDTSPIDIAIVHVDQNTTDNGPVAIVLFDGFPIFRTLTESEASTRDPLVAIEDEDSSIFGSGPNGRARIYTYTNRYDESLFVAFLDAIGHTEGANVTFIDASDTDHYHGSLVAEHIVDETRFPAFVTLVTETVQKFANNE